MPHSKSVRAPTTASLSSSLRVSSATPSLIKSFGRLSRQALIDLALEWLKDYNIEACRPYLAHGNTEFVEDSDISPYPAGESVDEIRGVYYDLQDRKGGKREVIDRILEGDWRHGVSLHQLATVDIRYLDDHPCSHRWTAWELVSIGKDTNKVSRYADDSFAVCIPRIYTSTFLSSLQQQISPLVKAHYHLVRSDSLPLTFLRIFVTDSPYPNLSQGPEILTDSSRVVYIAVPNSCPFIYTSMSTTLRSSAATAGVIGTDSRSLQRIVREAIPIALSRAHERYTLKPISLAAKSLKALLALRGPRRSNAANGVFSIFADAVLEGSPLDPRPANIVPVRDYIVKHSHEAEDSDGMENDKTHAAPVRYPNISSPSGSASKRRKLAVQSRFGTSGLLSFAPLDRLDIQLLDRLDEGSNSTELNRPAVSLTFFGTDIISGIRKLSELGVIDSERMPSWMTGEEAVSIAAVRQGKRIVKDNG